MCVCVFVWFDPASFWIECITVTLLGPYVQGEGLHSLYTGGGKGVGLSQRIAHCCPSMLHPIVNIRFIPRDIKGADCHNKDSESISEWPSSTMAAQDDAQEHHHMCEKWSEHIETTSKYTFTIIYANNLIMSKNPGNPCVPLPSNRLKSYQIDSGEGERLRSGRRQRTSHKGPQRSRSVKKSNAFTRVHLIACALFSLFLPLSRWEGQPESAAAFSNFFAIPIIFACSSEGAMQMPLGIRGGRYGA